MGSGISRSSNVRLQITNDQIVNGRLPSNISLKGFEELDFSGCYNLQIAPNFPVGVKKITLSSKNLHTIPTIPDGVEELNVTHGPSLRAIPNFPMGMKVIRLHNCTLLSALPLIPNEVEELHLSNCRSLETAPNFPAGLKRITLSSCEELETVPTIPNGVEELDFSGCKNLETAPNFPAGVKKIDLSFCKKLKTLPQIPDGVEELHLFNCSNLKTIPNFPEGVRIVNLSDCSKLISSPALLTRLSELEANGCEVRYPSYFNLNNQSAQAKTQREEIGQRYRTANNIEAGDPIPSAKESLHRFLNEGTDQRGGVKEIIQAVAPVLDILDENPDHLKWVEETAALYLSGCVNQPVAGWSEISALASIAAAPTMVKKMESAKHLLAIDQIKDFVTRTFPQAGVEIEAGNALLREMHKKLLADGDLEKPWLAVPGPIAYEKTIQNWLTPEIVQEFYNQIKPTLEKTPEQIAESLCESRHCKTWGEITFPQQVAEISNIYESQKKERWSEIEEMREGQEKEEAIEEFRKLGKKSALEQNEVTSKTIRELTLVALSGIIYGNNEREPAAAVASSSSSGVGSSSSSLVPPPQTSGVGVTPLQPPRQREK